MARPSIKPIIIFLGINVLNKPWNTPGKEKSYLDPSIYIAVFVSYDAVTLTMN